MHSLSSCASLCSPLYSGRLGATLALSLPTPIAICHLQCRTDTLPARHRQAEHAREVRELGIQGLELNEQLSSTVRMYNAVIADLKGELAEARKAAADLERRREADIKALSAQNSLDDDQLKQTLGEYKTMIR